MTTSTERDAASSVSVIGTLASAWPVVGIGYLVAYVLLDWASFIYPYKAFGITPWNPPAGLSFSLILLFGRRFIPLLVAAPLLADLIVRGWPLPFAVEITAGCLIAAVYGSALCVLTSPAVGFDHRLVSVRDVILLIAIAMVSAAIAAAAFVGNIVVAGVLPAAEFWSAGLRFWIGDVIGITVLTPFLLVFSTGQLSRPNSIENFAQGASILVVVMLVLLLPTSPDLQLLYLLFLPIIWIALRSGFEQTTIGLIVTQIALIVAVELTQEKAGAVTGFQILLLFLAITGLIMGAVVRQQRHAERQLRVQQEALARVARIGGMGALGAAIAHEINQPLSAIATYADIVQREMTSSDRPPALAAEAAQKLILQVNRAADIVRRMRNLIRLGQNQARPHSVQRIIDETAEVLRDELQQDRVTLQAILAPDLPTILADRIQVEQVLVNLIRNAAQAMSELPADSRVISIQVARKGADMVELSVHDVGSGFPADILKDDVLPLSSTKPDGMGLGLVLCRTIVEAHGGRLWIDSQGPGGIVRFTLKAVT